jgi:hypothetical protein
MAIRVGRLGRLGKRLSVTGSACHSSRRGRATSGGCADIDPAAVEPWGLRPAHHPPDSSSSALPLPRNRQRHERVQAGDAGACDVHWPRCSGCLGASPIPPPAARLAVTRDPACGDFLRSLRDLAGRTGLPGAPRAVSHAGPIHRAGPPHPDPHIRASQLGLATCADPARLVWRYTSWRPSCLERILSAPPVGALGGH